jgi:hypothetical protein
MLHNVGAVHAHGLPIKRHLDKASLGPLSGAFAPFRVALGAFVQDTVGVLR